MSRSRTLHRAATAVVVAAGLLGMAPAPARSDDESAPGAIDWFDGDLDAALAWAKTEGVPLMAYFTFET